ncbi:MAG: homocysteine S-methyltransferase family protein [Ignavibacteriales bacterium]|nr:homocysteine S-methyltransferase family protein [Ignavibacteriales bacterium]
MRKISLIHESVKRKRPLILNGAIGSYLENTFKSVNKYLWTSYLNISHAKEIIKLYKNYIEAGSDIISTNTFRTNPVSFEKTNIEIDYDEFVRKPILLSKESAKGKDIFIAGSNAPAEDCYQEERTISKYKLEQNHKKHIELLWENDCDFILNETQSHFDEIEIICKFCCNNSIPFIVSFFFTENLKLLDNTPIEEAINFVKEFNPLVIMFNCITPKVFSKLVNKIYLPDIWGFYLNCGLSDYSSRNFSNTIKPDNYIEIIKPYLQLSPTIIGSCCGSTPEHTKKIKDLFK